MKVQSGLAVLLASCTSAFLQQAPMSQDHLVCEVQLLETKPSTMRCGAVASPENRDHLMERSHSEATQHQCAKACWMDMDCKSFTWAPDVGVCKTFNATAREMKIHPSIDGRTKYFNKGCYTCTPRRFYLKTKSIEPNYNDKYVNIHVDKNNRGRGFFADMATHYFKMFENGIFTVGEMRLHSHQFWDDSQGPATNSYSSLVHFISHEYVEERKEKENIVQVNCHIHKDTHAFTCGSDAGNTFFGCRNTDKSEHDTSGLMLAPSGATDDSLHSLNCAPVTLVAEYLQ